MKQRKMLKVYDKKYFDELTKIFQLKEKINEFTTEINLFTKQVKYSNKKQQISSNPYKQKYKDRIFKELNLFDYYSERIKWTYDFVFIFDDELHKDILDKINYKYNDFQYIFYPKQKIEKYGYAIGNYYSKYPKFIISKGRWDKCLTAYSLLKIGISDFKIVVEEQEYEKYLQYFEEDNLLILDESYKKEYETLDNEKDWKNTGSGPARNFVWDYAKKNGNKFYWIFDDNIRSFLFYNKNNFYDVYDSSFFGYCEKIIESYDNIGMLGLNYESFLMRRDKNPPYFLNNRIFSMFLIKTDVPIRWKGRYNEDVILSIEFLKNGYATILTNFFVGDKKQTQRMFGGNTNEIYLGKGTIPKSKILLENYPESSKMLFKFGRWHHDVNYRFYVTEKNNIGKFIGKPLTDEEKQVFTLEKDKKKSVTIFDVYKMFGKEIPSYVNVDAVKRKLKKIKVINTEMKRKDLIKKYPFFNIHGYFNTVFEKEIKNPVFIITPELGQDKKLYKKLEKKLVEILPKNCNTIFNSCQTLTDALISIYNYYHKINNIDFDYWVKKDNNLLIKELEEKGINKIIVFNFETLPQEIKEKIKILEKYFTIQYERLEKSKSLKRDLFE